MSYARVPAFDNSGIRQMLHIFTRNRPGMTRGIPYLAPVIESLKQLDRYTEAEIMAAVISSMFTIFVKTESDEGLKPMVPMGAEDTAPARNSDYKLPLGQYLTCNRMRQLRSQIPSDPTRRLMDLCNRFCGKSGLRWNCRLKSLSSISPPVIQPHRQHWSRPGRHSAAGANGWHHNSANPSMKWS